MVSAQQGRQHVHDFYRTAKTRALISVEAAQPSMLRCVKVWIDWDCPVLPRGDGEGGGGFSRVYHNDDGSVTQPCLQE